MINFYQEGNFDDQSCNCDADDDESSLWSDHIDLVGGRVRRTVETDGRIISYCALTTHIIGMVLTRILIIQGHVDDDGDGQGGFEGVKVEESEYCFYRNLPENPSPSPPPTCQHKSGQR